MKIMKHYECGHTGPTYEELKEAVSIVNAEDCVAVLCWYCSGELNRFNVRCDMPMEKAEEKLYALLRTMYEGRFNGQGDKILKEFREKMDLATNRRYYLKLYHTKWDECYDRAKKEDPQADEDDIRYYATMTFEEEGNAEEVVGYYICYHGDDALKDWLSNTKGTELSDQGKEVDRILKRLYQV